MNYELALELQDAGWGRGKDDYCPPSLMCCEITLEELIKECGDDLNILVRGKDGFWYAESEQGKTPTEAVARLWLALKANTTV